MKKFPRLIRAFCITLNPKSWGVFLHAFEKTRFDHDFSVSWSQCGEDLAIVALLNASKRIGTYVDVGAHHPDRFSVTRALYQLGWTGIHVDADKSMEKNFRQRRPKDKFISGAVGTKDSYTFYRFNEKAVSTVSESWRDKYIGAGLNIEIVEEVPGISLNCIFKSLKEPVDFLNIDVEGADFDAIRSLELETLEEYLWPEWVMVESSPPITNVLNTDAVAYLISRGFEIWSVLPMATILRRGR